MAANDRRYRMEHLAALVPHLSKNQLQKHLGVSGTEWGRHWREGATARAADRFAVRCGFHPAEVWPTWLDDALADDLEQHGRDCARPTCTERFVPARRNQRFCSPECREAEEKRRYYQRRYARDPEFRQRRLDVGRRWYEECGDYARAKQRQRDRAKADARRQAGAA